MLLDTDTPEFRLLNDYQRDFPLVTRPFSRLAEELEISEQAVIATLAEFQRSGRISRVGPVFAPNRVGVSTLAALSVSEGRLESVAALVSGLPAVNHNYRREHFWNLWFVATAQDGESLARTLDHIQVLTGCTVLALPMEREYHIDLGFDLIHRAASKRKMAAARDAGLEYRDYLPPAGLVAALQTGLPLVPRPFEAVASSLGLTEAAVLAALETMEAAGIIKRLGVVVRHHEMGFGANAMCVWDLPETEVDRLGAALAGEPAVTLCYRRRRGERERAMGWPYNLFCMIHGREREQVEALRADIILRHGLGAHTNAMLFSTRRFKQCGARYGREAALG